MTEVETEEEKASRLEKSVGILSTMEIFPLTTTTISTNIYTKVRGCRKRQHPDAATLTGILKDRGTLRCLGHPGLLHNVKRLHATYAV